VGLAIHLSGRDETWKPKKEKPRGFIEASPFKFFSSYQSWVVAVLNGRRCTRVMAAMLRGREYFLVFCLPLLPLVSTTARSMSDHSNRRDRVVVDAERLDKMIKAGTKPSRRQRGWTEVNVFEELPDSAEDHKRRHFVIPITANTATHSSECELREICR
jgi:hypothetical protein